MADLSINEDAKRIIELAGELQSEVTTGGAMAPSRGHA